MRHPLLSVGWIFKHLFALTIFVTLVGLGFWQLDRLEQRRAANAERVAVLSQNPATITGQGDDPSMLAGRRVRVTGTFLNEESVLLRGQKSDSGVEGVHLLTPLRISGSEQAVMVDRGWLPAGRGRGAARDAFAVSREITLEGLALPGETRADSALAARDLPLPGETRIDAWVRVDVARMQSQISTSLLPFYVEQLPEDGQGSALPRPRDPTRLDEGPHLSYALQWFAFALMLGVVYAALMRQELTKGVRRKW